jgi:hypothetical protein
VSELLVFGRILVCSTPNVNENRFRNAVNGFRSALTAKGRMLRHPAFGFVELIACSLRGF